MKLAVDPVRLAGLLEKMSAGRAAPLEADEVRDDILESWLSPADISHTNLTRLLLANPAARDGYWRVCRDMMASANGVSKSFAGIFRHDRATLPPLFDVARIEMEIELRGAGDVRPRVAEHAFSFAADGPEGAPNWSLGAAAAVFDEAHYRQRARDNVERVGNEERSAELAVVAFRVTAAPEVLDKTLPLIRQRVAAGSGIDAVLGSVPAAPSGRGADDEELPDLMGQLLDVGNPYDALCVASCAGVTAKVSDSTQRLSERFGNLEGSKIVMHVHSPGGRDAWRVVVVISRGKEPWESVDLGKVESPLRVALTLRAMCEAAEVPFELSAAVPP